MDLEPESLVHHGSPVSGVNSSIMPTSSATSVVVSQVDIENELREFLESGSDVLAPATDDAIALEHMLMN